MSDNDDKVNYYDNDFDAFAWIESCRDREGELPPILPEENKIQESDEVKQWDDFFRTHGGGQFFKPRNYVYPAYKKWFDNCQSILEVGCGHGCTIFPLLAKECLTGVQFIATDYSAEALGILQMHSDFCSHRIFQRQWDITQDFSHSTTFPNECDEFKTNCRVDVVVCLFVLSALHPDRHIAALQNMRNILPDNGVILFRDYGICDMTMYRHKCRLSNHLYRRTDGTLSYYFDLDYLRSLCKATGFYPVELKYATVEVSNRKKGLVMRRVFVHAVLMKSCGDDRHCDDSQHSR